MVHKRRLKSGKVVWSYKFDRPGSTKLNRSQAQKHGFTTKKAAQDAEAAARIEEKGKAKDTAAPLSLSSLLTDFFADCGDLALKTLERYRELAAYLSPEILAMPIKEITALHLHREWKRLAESGGHDRKERKPRPLSAKTVRHVCGVVSSAFGRAQRWGIVQGNPTTVSDPPKVTPHEGIALAPSQTQLMVEAARIAWMPAFLELDSATGCRRGELLALEWSDLEGNTLTIARSLSQTRAGLAVKLTKKEKPRRVDLDDETLGILVAHRQAQERSRQHFGQDYRGNLIFANSDGSPLKPDSVSSAVSLLIRRLKLPKGVSLHTLRHTHGSQQLAAGVPITDVSRRLGHADVATTLRIYAHALPGRDGEAARKWREFQKAGIDPAATRQ